MFKEITHGAYANAFNEIKNNKIQDSVNTKILKSFYYSLPLKLFIYETRQNSYASLKSVYNCYQLVNTRYRYRQ